MQNANKRRTASFVQLTSVRSSPALRLECMEEDSSSLTRPNLPEAHLMLLLLAVLNIHWARAGERIEAMLD